jgi:energy-coupling factor transporter ATP-binding protein EcfA2
MRGQGARGSEADGTPVDGGRFRLPLRGRSAPRAEHRRGRRGAGVETALALALASVWVEHKGGAAVLRGVDLAIAGGERVALMGRNGAGKSTLLRVAAGLTASTRGSVRRSGRVALLLQNPGDYTLRDRVGDELPPDVLAAAGLGALSDRHPRDLSGGERQRLALALVLHGDRPAVLCLDEPTRGMDRGHKDALAKLLKMLAADGTAVIVATHDAEFVAAFSARTVLLGDGRPVADAPTADVLAGGWYFATQTARILGGAALLPEDGAALLRREAVVA